MGAHVLVVDDDDVLASLVADVLSDEGYAVQLALSRQQAQALLTSPTTAAFDVILSDSFRLPGEDAYIWLDELKASTSIPIVIMSGWETGAYTECRSRGFAASLPKPFDLDELLALVARLEVERPHVPVGRCASTATT